MRPLLSNIPPLNVTLLFKLSVLCKANQAKENRANWPIGLSAYYFFYEWK